MPELTRAIKIPLSILGLVIDTLNDNASAGGDEDQGDLADKLERELPTMTVRPRPGSRIRMHKRAYASGDTVELTSKEMGIISDEFDGLVETGCYAADGKNVTASMAALVERCHKGWMKLDHEEALQ